MKNHVITATLALTIGMSAPLVAHAQSAADQLQEYRAMLADGNPAELYEMEGEELWVKAMGPKNASLEKCDLGLGPGVVEGAAAQLPRECGGHGRRGAHRLAPGSAAQLGPDHQGPPGSGRTSRAKDHRWRRPRHDGRDDCGAARLPGVRDGAESGGGARPRPLDRPQ